VSAYQVMPPLTPEEIQALYADIEANGVRVPVDVDEDGNILDGHHRVEIATSIGIGYPVRVLDGLTEAQKVAHAYAVNLNRRSLNREQKRALVAASLIREPELSDRQHAERTGVSHPTVAAVRDELVEEGQLEDLSSRTGADGKTRPAHVTTTSRTTESTKVEQDVNTDTGEILDDGPSRAGRAAADAVMDVIANNAGYRQANLVKGVIDAYAGWKTPIGIEPADAALLPLTERHVDSIHRNLAAITSWVTAFDKSRAGGLRLVAGGK
jgi:ParB-like chromosome segregation protein Spo0J